METSDGAETAADGSLKEQKCSETASEGHVLVTEHAVSTGSQDGFALSSQEAGNRGDAAVRAGSSSANSVEVGNTGDADVLTGSPSANSVSVNTTTEAAPPPMSKRQQKRLAKREAYLALLPQLRRAERQRRKEKRAAAVAAGVAPKRPRLTRMTEGGCDVRVVIDLSFDELMTDRDLGKCLKQVQRCYAANRRARRPLQLHLSSMDGRSRVLMDANDGWANWDVHVHREHFRQALDPASITYLSSESEHELTALEPGRAYVIGGLVDHNHHKGLCLRRAEEAGLSHARLPIDQFVQMRTRKVLTIDHVFCILLEVAAGRSWQEALCTVLPARKGAVVREPEQEQSEAELEAGLEAEPDAEQGGSGEKEQKPKPVASAPEDGDSEPSAESQAGSESNGRRKASQCDRGEEIGHSENAQVTEGQVTERDGVPVCSDGKEQSLTESGNVIDAVTAAAAPTLIVTAGSTKAETECGMNKM
ncbi:tRNA methyltransferase 10 homolog A-like [Pollicipes pollicipes]|uniref:tRNA methyltransferase 10 homolog A-like n=1 Tax=Pollicipes pollicipes TaxID=41117 RepID=UPI0018849B3D|nr:tRNA methyltransferase 10 homolog A-like [Pollicipes pollicipes]